MFLPFSVYCYRYPLKCNIPMTKTHPSINLLLTSTIIYIHTVVLQKWMMPDHALFGTQLNYHCAIALQLRTNYGSQMLFMHCWDSGIEVKAMHERHLSKVIHRQNMPRQVMDMIQPKGNCFRSLRFQ